MRQLFYVSASTVTGDKGDLAGILEQSRHNNALEGVTGLLWSDGAHFLQVLEGSPDSVGATFERISRDPRHSHIVVLHDREIEAREFGGWSMVHRRANEPADLYDAKVGRLLASAAPDIRERFIGLIATGEIAR